MKPHEVSLSAVLLFSFGILGFCVLLFLMSGCSRLPSKTPARDPIVVCIEHPDMTLVKRGIEWWGEPVVYSCPGVVTVRTGPPPPMFPEAMGWRRGNEIVHVSGFTDVVVKHEFGHFLYGQYVYGDYDVTAVGGTW